MIGAVADMGSILKFDGTPRSALEDRIRLLVKLLEAANKENLQLNENLTHVQARCTEQELELRRHRAEARVANVAEGAFLLDALHANDLAKVKYPGPYTLEHMLCVLAEETGEACRAHCHDEGATRIRAELVQVAGVCARIAVECLDEARKSP